jgi:alpha-D-xyloside xylohydrolase
MSKNILSLFRQNCYAAVIFAALFFSANTAKAEVKSYKADANGVTFTLDKGLMMIKVCAPDIIQVRYTMLDAFAKKVELVVNNPWLAKTTFSVTQEDGAVIITTARLKISIDKATNAVTYYDKGGNVITSEAKENNKTMEASTVAGISTYTCSNIFNSPADEALYGLGCHPTDTGSINYKGRDQSMLIKYMTGAIPVMLSTKGYGIFWDNYAASDFYGGVEGNTKYKYTSESGKEVNYYFFYGPDFDHIINIYRTATGKAPMFGKWAFGLFQSQDRYKSQAEIIGVKNSYRDNNIPVDVVVQDWYWWSPLPIGSHVMNHDRYPDPKAMIDELHKAHMHAMISIWPVFGAGTADFNDLKAHGYLTSITWDNFVTHTFDTYYDAHNPKARTMYWQQARDSVVKRYGWDAWWVDQCEPDNGSLLDERRKAVFSVGPGIDFFNTYSLEHSKGIYGGWRKDIPGKRAFFLIRQSFAGEQRNAAVLWSSDVTTTFDALKSQVPQGINSCISGIPYWTSDIGGYISHTDPDGVPNWTEPARQELFTRWFQFGTFCPIMRIHGKGERALFSSNWSDSTKAVLLKYDKLRYRLMPYIYSLAGRTTQENYTMMRSLAFDFRGDKGIVNIPDQYMFGPAFMVSPVTEQMYTGPAMGKTTRSVYLPASTSWYDFYTGKKYDGGQTIDAAAPINVIPVFVKAGSIVPMGPVEQYATEKTAKVTELRIYPGADGKFEYYEDENEGYSYEKGSFGTFKLSWNDKTHMLTISDEKGNFPGMLKSRKFNVVIVDAQHGINTDMSTKTDKVVTYTGKALTVKI